jgi:UDP-GlcNAc:undecaprenyl-phosphate GlcNAc-1-phosphate transferase
VFQDDDAIRDVEWPSPLSGPSAVFRLSSGHDLLLTISLHQAANATLAADIAFRFLQRLALATAERLEGLIAARGGTGARGAADNLTLVVPDETPAPKAMPPSAGVKSRTAKVLALSTTATRSRPSWNWLRIALGWETRPVAHHPSLGKE